MRYDGDAGTQGRADLAVQLHGASWCLHPPRFLMQMRNTVCGHPGPGVRRDPRLTGSARHVGRRAIHAGSCVQISCGS